MSLNAELRQQLERQIQTRTGGRVHNLAIEVKSDALVLLGEAGSYYIKQLALCGARDLLPSVPVANAITVVKQPVA
jgi:hypothetical protein